MIEADATQFVASLFDAWYPFILRYAVRLSGSFPLAEESVQEAYFALFQALGRGQKIENPRAWLLTVVRRSLSSLVQAESRARCGGGSLEDLTSEPAAPGKPPIPFEWDDLQRFFHLLSPRELEVLLLRMQPLKYHDIARALGISVPSVGTLLMRAIAKLKHAAAPAAASSLPDLGDFDEPRTLQ